MDNKEKEISIAEQLQSNCLVTTILKSISEGVLFIDASGKIVFVNPRLCELFGFSEVEMIGEPLSKLIPGSHHHHHSGHIQNYFESPMNRPMGSGNDLIAIRPDGEQIPIEISLNYLKCGNETLCLAFVSDISCRKKAEKEIREKNVKLIQMNEEVLQQRNLLQKSNVELEKLNATKNKFFSIIAHDLKNPFAGMLIGSELLIKSIKNGVENKEGLLRKAENIHNSTRNGFKLLENLLEWSRSQMDEIKYNPGKICITEIIRESILSMHSFIESKNIKLSYDAKPYRVFADNNMLSTIMRNLLSNAFKFTPENGTVHISMEDKDDKLIVIVSDSGIGMSDENKSKLFNPEHRFVTPGTQNEKGSGLGLYLCKEFVEMNAGKIWVESKIGKGSKFYFSLPLVKNPESASFRRN